MRRLAMFSTLAVLTACGSSTTPTPAASVPPVATTPPATVTLQATCPSIGPPTPTVCLANLETDLYYTISRAGEFSYAVNFGDGQTCGSLDSCGAQVSGAPTTKRWFPHTYPDGTFTAKLTVTDAGGQATATTTVLVKSLSGSWVSGSGSDGCLGQRRLQLTQAGTSLGGLYTNPFGNSDTIGAGSSVSSLRDVRVTIPSPGLTFGGMYIDGYGVSPDASALVLQITVGDPSCGRPTLTFHRS